MTTKKYEILSDRLKEAANKGNKVYVISNRGRWVVFKGNEKNILVSKHSKEEAINIAMKILIEGQTEKVVLHNENGKVESIYLKPS